MDFINSIFAPLMPIVQEVLNVLGPLLEGL